LGAPVEPAVISEVRDLVNKAKHGDASVLPRLRHLLDDNPAIWEFAGDLERIVVRAWCDYLANGDPLTREAVQRKAQQLRTDLEGDHPTPLERLLVGQVVSHWLEMSHAQVAVTDAAGLTHAQAKFNLKRVESAQRRYLAGIRTLTTVRALVPRGLLPANPIRLHDPERKKA